MARPDYDVGCIVSKYAHTPERRGVEVEASSTIGGEKRLESFLILEPALPLDIDLDIICKEQLWLAAFAYTEVRSQRFMMRHHISQSPPCVLQIDANWCAPDALEQKKSSVRSLDTTMEHRALQRSWQQAATRRFGCGGDRAVPMRSLTHELSRPLAVLVSLFVMSVVR